MRQKNVDIFKIYEESKLKPTKKTAIAATKTIRFKTPNTQRQVFQFLEIFF